MDYDVVFPSIFVISFKPVFKEAGSSLAIHYFSFCWGCSFRSTVFFSDSSLLSAGFKKNCSSSATFEEGVVTSMGVVWMSSRILRRISSVNLGSSLERKSAAVLTEPEMCAILKLNCNTSKHAFHSVGGIAFVWKKRVTDLLSVGKNVGFVASHRSCAKSRNAMWFAKSCSE